MNISIKAILIAVAAVAAYFPAFAQEYPTKSVRIIVPFTPGGGNDIVARILAPHFSTLYKQQFVVENRPGAGTLIGVDVVAKSAPDGYTLMVTNNALAVNQTLYPKPPYDALKDITVIDKIASTPNILVVHPSVPAKTTKDFVALVKSKPGQV